LVCYCGLTGKQEQRKQRDISNIALLGASLSLAGMIVAGCVIGYLIDRYAATAPLGIIIGAIVGTAVGILDIYRIAVRSMANEPNKSVDKSESDDAG
jgi:F0F1-type ATP synthase assembly protein I